MKKNLTILTASYTVFIFFLFLSGAFSGFLSDVIYYLAFIIPITLALLLTRKELGDMREYLTIDREGISLSWPVIFPTIAVTMLISYLTSLLIFAVTGKTNYVELGDSYILALINHALLPALLEEALFRYLPLKLIAPYSKRGAIFISAAFFALVHHNLFTIPYAFFCGVVFMALALATESIIPTIVLHFINNALSVSLGFIFYDGAALMLYIWIGLMTLLSAIYIYRKRDNYWIAMLMINDKGEGMMITTEMVLFALVTLGIAVMNLLLS